MTDLGAKLKEARMEKNLSLEQIQDVTKIQKRYLIGIEEGNYSIMPGSFYVRAFIKQYAEAVGLDPDMLFNDFQHDIPKTFQDDVSQKLSRVQTRRQISPQSSKLLEFLPTILVVLFVVGVVVLFWVYWQNSDFGKENNTNIEQPPTSFEESETSPLKKEDMTNSDNQDKSEPEPAPEPEPEPEPAPPQQKLTFVETTGNLSTFKLEQAENMLITIEANGGDTWIEVKNSKGAILFGGQIIKVGESTVVDASKEADVIIKAGADIFTVVKVNEEVLPFPIPTEPNKPKIQRLQIINNQVAP
ncbi:helix-turn-helix domain-containing protein [Bacillus salinus]|uniref:helix-turn-helix domain-containing protein n=1 Tax=Bacillus sp. HMF5848 TaxID=2495421 RepID=UPI0016395C31|nr:helix-turn-helix domain-containing protein [Bacillus sp. HMF5848]